MKVANRNHLNMSRCLRQSLRQVRHKPVCVALMEFSPLQCMGKVGDKVSRLCRGHQSRKSATRIMKIGDTICVTDLHDLCLRLSPQGSFGQSRKVGVMEFGLNTTKPRLAWAEEHLQFYLLFCSAEMRYILEHIWLTTDIQSTRLL